ncbi:MAG: hypothetical protein M1814_000140 [Vezdaea aestivalis]|nr:MAG: hypothetical protein M1814_000140 [Vezdaea aestivalis]
MAEDDIFDIDIYGDGADDYSHEHSATHSKKGEDNDLTVASPTKEEVSDSTEPLIPEVESDEKMDIKTEDSSKDIKPKLEPSEGDQHIASTNGSGPAQVEIPKQAPQKQGTKRKDGADDRPLDNGATSALLIQDLHWWQTDDDIRGWINQTHCEDELRDITFSEHKVNGKSKGQAFVEFISAQASTAVKQKIESFGSGEQYAKKHAVSFTNPVNNPFRTLPKDAPARDKNHNRDSRAISGGPPNMTNTPGTSNYNPPNSMGRGNFSRGNYNNRGGMNGGMGGFGNRNFSGPMNGGFQPTPIASGFPNQMGGMQQFNNFANRGNMMGGMRGGARGRGGMGMMPNMGMGAMGMGIGGMPGQMGMGMNMGGMGMQGQGGFQSPQQGQFSPGFYNQQNQQGVQGHDWNPHGGKRPRIE